MVIKPLALALALTLACGSASACSRVIQITLDFPEGSAQLDSKQIVRLANWLGEVRGWFQYGDGEVEGVAVGAKRENKELARRRADVTARALQSLYEDLPVHSSSNVYSPADVRSNGNYAVVQLNPTNAPDCNPVPIPGFKR